MLFSLLHAVAFTLACLGASLFTSLTLLIGYMVAKEGYRSAELYQVAILSAVIAASCWLAVLTPW